MPHPLDEKARPILFDTYWKGGWIPAPQTDPADLAYAQAQGLMFAPVTRSHEECLSQRLECRERLPARTAGRAFVARLACAGVPRAADLDRPARGKSDWRCEDGYCAETAAAWFGPWLAWPLRGRGAATAPGRPLRLRAQPICFCQKGARIPTDLGVQ